MQTSTTAPTLPISATVGDGHASAFAEVRLTDDGFELSLAFGADGDGGPAVVSSIADAIRAVDPEWLRGMVAARGHGLRLDPYAVTLDVLADHFDTGGEP